MRARQHLVRWLALALLAWAIDATAAEAPRCPPTVTATATDATAPARDRGLLWRITRDGRASYLFGTLHVGKPGWRRFGPQVSAALRAVDVLALEIDPGDPDLLKAMAELRPPQDLPPALQQRLARAFERACVAADSMATLHPVLQATSLTVLEARWFSLDPNFALEQALAAQARTLGRRVVSLETAAQQTQALVPDDEAEAQALLDQSLQQLEDGSARRVLQRLSAAWERGDLATLEDYEKWCECIASEAEREFLRQLNDERNPGLAAGIEAQHKLGRRVFAAVGALHFTGPQALQTLLARRGFRVERIVFAH
ncbi:conserved exported hypothetical protein [Rubrivivax sp. A210]|uniref:TraB/GumN family protein n=1 Tax=Rubrivivax sp. A210 TaxID=2772301 RepID=UPI00191B2D99|nr:TraB/GumN family protein [Rubrivivax sp. A210]CAD5370325.1 conserved exported hypothetical protein [Rubrivivax sp. A210]